MRLTTTIPLALLAALDRRGRRPARRPASRGLAAHHRTVDRHQASVEPGVVARQPPHRVHLGARRRRQPLRCARRRLGEADADHDRGVPGNVFWSPDSKSLLFFRGGTALMTLPLDGTPPTPRFGDFAPRSPSVSRDGTKIVYLAGGGAIRVRSLVDDSDTLVATVTEPIATVSWINDSQLALTSGGGRGETRRHEQTPDYSGSKIIYTITERMPGAPAGTWVLPITGGSPKAYSTGEGGGGRGGNRWIDATHFLIDRQTPDFKRRTISVGSVTGGEPRLVHEDVKDKFWSMTGDARGGSQASPDGKWISFVSDRDGWDHLYVAPASGGAPVQITKGQYEAWRPSWSPDGTRIAFDSNEGGNPGNRAAPRRHGDRRSGARHDRRRHEGARHQHRRPVVARRPAARLPAHRSAELRRSLRRRRDQGRRRRRSG